MNMSFSCMSIFMLIKVIFISWFHTRIGFEIAVKGNLSMAFVTLMRIHFKMIITFLISFHYFSVAERDSMQSSAQLATDGEPPAKKKTYTCSNCKKPGHRRNHCPLNNAGESVNTESFTMSFALN